MMQRILSCLSVIVAMSAGSALAQWTPFMVNGSPTLAFFDANGNCLPDDGDCFVTAVGTQQGAGGGGILVDTVMQLTQNTAAPGTVPLQICEPCSDSRPSGTNTPPMASVYSGFGQLSPAPAGPVGTVVFNQTCNMDLGTPWVQGTFAAVPLTDAAAPSSVLLGQAKKASTAALPAGANPVLQAPLEVQWGGIIAARDDIGTNSFVVGTGAFCRADGQLAVRAQGRGGIGPSFLVDLETIDAGGSQYICTEVPMPRADTRAIVWIKSCFPIADNVSTLTFGDLPVAQVVFDGLQPCIAAAPTATEWGLVGLTAVLLAVGTWGLSRRPGFVRALRNA